MSDRAVPVGFSPVTEISVVTHGEVAEPDVDYGVDCVAKVLGHTTAPILAARMTLSWSRDPAREKRAMAKVFVDLDGHPVRAHVAAHQMREALDLLERRLHEQLEQLAERRDELHRSSGHVEPGQWRRGAVATARPEFFERPPGEREVVRRKTFAVPEQTPEEAAFDMDQLDHDFYLFRELATGTDALLERREDGSYWLTRLRPAGLAGGVPPTIDLADSTPPVLDEAEAIERLDAGGERFVFYADAATGRGHVLYRRYDGHYGLITPTDL